MEIKQSRPKQQQAQVSSKSPNEDSGPRLRSPRSGPRPNANPNLDSFEAVMEAMEAELNKARLAKNPSGQSKAHAANSSRKRREEEEADPLPLKGPKGKEKAIEGDEKMDDEDEDVAAAMDAELRAALEREEGDSGDEEPMDYGMIKNFLESFKSQAGLAGPVSSLAGRLQPGWLPRDET